MRLLLFNLATDVDDPILGFTTTWINALARHCTTLDVLTMRVGQLAVASNVRVFSVGKERGYGETQRVFEFYRILTTLLRETHYDACFAHMMPLFAVLGAPLLKLNRIPTTLWHTHKATPLLLQMAEKVVDQVVTASSESFRLPSNKVTVIGHGIDTTHFIPTPKEKTGTYTILSVARLSPIKHIETIIEAIHLLVSAHPELSSRLRLIGDAYPQHADYAKRLHQMTDDFQLAEIIQFVGSVKYENIVHEYQSADVLVNMSDTGSLDKAVLEAMACGTLVITSNVAFREMLSPYNLFLPQNDATLLAKRLARLAAQSPAERAAVSQSLRAEVVTNHSLENLTQKLLELLPL